MTTTHRTTAVPNADPRKDLRVITSPDGRILSDRRDQTPTSNITLPSQQRPPFRRVIVKGRKQK